MKTEKSVSNARFACFLKPFILLVLPCIILTSNACGGDDEAPDPCDGITCVRGNCVNGDCVCPEGYGGPDCSQELTPLDMFITSIKVKDFPVTNGPTQWDIGIGKILPELKVKIHREGSNGVMTAFVLNAQEGEHNIPLPDGKITLAFPDQNYFFELLDDDSNDDGDDDLMETVQRIPYQKGGNFPTLLELKGSKITLELTVEYLHDKE